MPEFKQGLADGAEPNELRDVAYALAEANVHPSEAQDWSTRAVSAISEKTMDITPEHTEPSDFSLMLQLAASGDTLGWIKFRAGDFPGAENYLEAAWQLLQSAVIGEHLVEPFLPASNTRNPFRMLLLPVSFARRFLAAPSIQRTVRWF